MCVGSGGGSILLWPGLANSRVTAENSFVGICVQPAMLARPVLSMFGARFRVKRMDMELESRNNLKDCRTCVSFLGSHLLAGFKRKPRENHPRGGLLSCYWSPLFPPSISPHQNESHLLSAQKVMFQTASWGNTSQPKTRPGTRCAAFAAAPYASPALPQDA